MSEVAYNPLRHKLETSAFAAAKVVVVVVVVVRPASVADAAGAFAMLIFVARALNK